MLYASKSPHTVIVFEDITPKGYVMAKKLLNENASKIVAKRLALYHACSYFMNENVSLIQESSSLSWIKDNKNLHFFLVRIIGSRFL